MNFCLYMLFAPCCLCRHTCDLQEKHVCQVFFSFDDCPRANQRKLFRQDVQVMELSKGPSPCNVNSWDVHGCGEFQVSSCRHRGACVMWEHGSCICGVFQHLWVSVWVVLPVSCDCTPKNSSSAERDDDDPDKFGPGVWGLVKSI